MIWNPGNIDKLLELWKEGFTTGQIAIKLDTTKNAICGKLVRLREVLGDGHVPYGVAVKRK